MNEFRRASNEFRAQIEQEISHLEVEKQTILAPSTPVEGTESRPLTTLEAPATLAASEEAPVPPSEHPAEPPATTEALNPSDTVTSTTSQESHA